MTNAIDLQVHSTASDGKHAPREVVQIAKENKVEIISLTDHDTVAGLDAALEAGKELGVRVIPGIEFSVEDHGSHLLGYGIDHKNPQLLQKLEEAQQGRMEGAKKMAENLKQAGFFIEWEDVLREATGAAVIARPHICRAILNNPKNKEKLSGISTVHEFIQAYLLDDSPYYVPRTHIGAKDAIGLIKSSGGVAVWSHPAIHFQNNHEGLEIFLRELIEQGLRGIEVFTSAHTEDDAEFVQSLARANSLLRTCGSDFHEKEKHQLSENGLHAANTVGDYDTYGFAIDDIVLKLEEEINKARQLGQNFSSGVEKPPELG